MVGASWIVLEVGDRPVEAKDLVDGEEIFSAERRNDALLLEWIRRVPDLDPVEESAEEVLALVGEPLLKAHHDNRGVLIIPVRGLETPNGTYEQIVARYAATGRFIPNFAKQRRAANPIREMREEIPLPDVPNSKPVEIFVMDPERAVRELPLSTEPGRVVCVDRMSELQPDEVSDFYLPLLRRKGYSTKRRVWSDQSAEQLVAKSGARMMIVHAERADEGTFVRVALVLP
jgi:hypothetical protein